MHAKKRYGQNFLRDETILERIVETAGIGKEDSVLEIGPGTGALTVRLASCAGTVLSVEIDETLKAPLTKTLLSAATQDVRSAALPDNVRDPDSLTVEDALRIGNVTVLFRDILKTDLAVLRDVYNSGAPFHVVANLPYYITTPVLLYLLRDAVPPLSCTVMVQKEVALRMAASPGNKDYGALSVIVSYYATPQIAFDVPPHAFFPQPKVDSSVLRLTPLDAPPVTPKDRDFFFTVVQQSFAHRRKTLVNSLSAAQDDRLTKEKITKALRRLAETIASKPEDAGLHTAHPVDERIRAERLTMADFAMLSDFLYS